MPYVNSKCLLRTIGDFFSGYNVESISLHTDICSIGILDKIKNHNEMADDYMQLLCQAVGDGTLLFPTFNYTFTKTHLYRVKSDPCQVGALNEYIRMKYPSQRTLTPIFNFVILNNNQKFSLGICKNPFEKDSIFGQMVKKSSWIAFFGASFNSNTFIHHLEEIQKISYRYIKIFNGIVETDDASYSISLEYRVRPQIEEAVEYDFIRLENDLIESGLLFQHNIGSGRIAMFRSDLVFQFWQKKLKEDEQYFLTQKSRANIQNIYSKFGYPLMYESIEGENCLNFRG
jgi:aminoglycoside N3'-acetyltransferase